MNDFGDFRSFLGAIGCLYVKANLCTPFYLPEFAQAWLRDGIRRSHCLRQIGSHLAKNSGQYRNGSGDWGLSWLDAEIRESWHRLNRPPRKLPERTDRLYKRVGAYVGVDETDERFVDPMEGVLRMAGSTTPETIDKAKHELEEPCDVPNRHPNQVRAAPTAAPRLPHATPSHAARLKPIDRALAFLLEELSHGEVAAVDVEANARDEGISARTLDRARTRLGIVSRRSGFGREGRSWLSLPSTPRAA